MYSDFAISICVNRKSRDQRDFRHFRIRSIKTNYTYPVLNMEHRHALNSLSGSNSNCMKSSTG